MNELTLEQFRQQQGWSFAELAQWMGVTQAATARRYALGLIMPDPPLVKTICELSGQLVTPEAMYRLHYDIKTGGAGSKGAAPGPMIPSPIAAEPQTSAAALGGLTSGPPSGPSCAPPSNPEPVNPASH